MSEYPPPKLPKKTRLPEIRARPFNREKDPPAQIANLLSRKQQGDLRAIATVLEFERGDRTIFSEGEDAHFVYAVANGVVRVSRHAENGRRQVMALMLPGDLFGLPHEGLYVNCAETVCPSTLYRVPWQQWNTMMRREPDMQITLLVRVAFDLRQAQRRIMILGQQNASQKLASFLLDFAEYPEFYDTRRRQLELPLTRFDLGDYLGVAAETVVRTFAKLERGKIIRRLSSRRIEIEDMDALRRLVNGRRRSPR